MRSLIITACMITGALALTGCNNSGSSSNEPEPLVSTAELAFTADTNDEPITLNPDTLKTELIDLFGSANDDPVAVNDGDTVDDILYRAQ